MKLNDAYNITEEYLDKGDDAFTPKKIASKKLNFEFINTLKKLKGDEELSDKIEKAFNGSKSAKESLKKWLIDPDRKKYSDDILNTIWNIINK